MGLIAAFGPIWILTAIGYLTRRRRLLADNMAEVLGAIVLTVLDRYDDAAGRIRFRRIASLPLRNPVILASGLGVIASATGFRLPSILLDPMTLLGAAAVPTALIALGASLYRPPARIRPAEPGETFMAEETAPAETGASQAEARADQTEPALTELAVISVLKLAVQPAVALAAAFAFDLPHPELVAVVVCARLPTAQNALIYAQRYHAADSLASRSIMVTTTLSMATLIIIAALLGR